MDENHLKERLRRGECLFGPFVRTTDPVLTEIVAYAGFDFVILDCEHGPMSIHQVENLVRAARCAGTAPVVRVRENSETMIVRALDTASAGVQVPQINSRQAACEAVRAAKFYPAGERGVCRFTRNAQYGMIPTPNYFTQANENTLTILQIEGLGGVNCVDEILDTEGLDVLFLGPYDLSQALGVPGVVTHPKVLDTIARITQKARDRKIAVGSFADEVETLRIHKEMGIQYLSCGIDTGMVYAALRARLDELRTAL